MELPRAPKSQCIIVSRSVLWRGCIAIAAAAATANPFKNTRDKTAKAAATISLHPPPYPMMMMTTVNCGGNKKAAAAADMKEEEEEVGNRETISR